MTEYWKAIPKKYCDACKCWFTDNKSSVEFHERGLRHQNNVKKKLSELTKRNQVQKHETDKYNSQLMKIEAAALSAFSKDIAADPSKVQELATTKSMISTIKMPKDEASTSLAGNRFGGGGVSIYGDCMEENKILVSGREKALDTITSKMSKKYQWLESKTSEGKAYYWNRKTLETIWEPPSSGYLTIDEQQKMGINRDNVPLIGTPGYKYDPYGQWENIGEKSTETSSPDFQLPQSANSTIDESKVLEIHLHNDEEQFDFKEKTIETKTKSSGPVGFSFKKRKIIDKMSRNVKKREDDN